MLAICYPGRYCLPNKIIGLPDVAVNNKQKLSSLSKPIVSLSKRIETKLLWQSGATRF